MCWDSWCDGFYNTVSIGGPTSDNPRSSGLPLPQGMVNFVDRVWSVFRDRHQLMTPFSAPNANSVAVTLIGTLRRECLDHMIIFNERHLKTVLTSSSATTTEIAPIAH